MQLNGNFLNTRIFPTVKQFASSFEKARGQPVERKRVFDAGIAELQSTKVRIQCTTDTNRCRCTLQLVQFLPNFQGFSRWYKRAQRQNILMKDSSVSALNYWMTVEHVSEWESRQVSTRNFRVFPSVTKALSVSLRKRNSKLGQRNKGFFGTNAAELVHPNCAFCSPQAKIDVLVNFTSFHSPSARSRSEQK